MLIRGPNENAKRAYQLAFRTMAICATASRIILPSPFIWNALFWHRRFFLLSHRNVPFLLIFLCPTP